MVSETRSAISHKDTRSNLAQAHAVIGWSVSAKRIFWQSGDAGP
jgi:hypothetical protein